MKTFAVIAVPLVLLFTNASTPNNVSDIEKNESSTFEIYSVHNIEIEQNVDPEAFETFVINELAPIYDKMKGQKLILVKGDRGMRTNKYAIILAFESIEDRNRIYPPEGGLVGDFGSAEVWEKFDSMTTTGLGVAHTDYVVVDHQK
jgi:hypothetical protein